MDPLPTVLPFSQLSVDTIHKWSCKQGISVEYFLFKTHKLYQDQLLEVDILGILKRFLQSADGITSSRITVFLEIIFKPISKNCIQFQLNEYCRDSKHYHMKLKNRKST